MLESAGVDAQSLVRHSAGVGRPVFEVAARACDCHMHLFDPAVPYVSEAALKHAAATVDDYQGLQRRLGLQRCVLVQPSSYGVDNSLLLRGLEALGDSARGVAVVDTRFTRAQLAGLAGQGVVGARFNLVQAGATHPQMLQPVADAVAEFGWHLQLHAHAQHLVELTDRLVELPVPLVIDHFARVNVDGSCRQDLMRSLRRLLDTGKTWVKLSAPYIAAPNSTDYADLDDFVQDLGRKYMDRLVWGSDWPHVTEPVKPDDAALMNVLARWFSSAERQQILVDNAAALYSFDAT